MRKSEDVDRVEEGRLKEKARFHSISHLVRLEKT